MKSNQYFNPLDKLIFFLQKPPECPAESTDMDILAGNLAANAGEPARKTDPSSEPSQKSETPLNDPDARNEPPKSSNSTSNKDGNKSRFCSLIQFYLVSFLYSWISVKTHTINFCYETKQMRALFQRCPETFSPTHLTVTLYF